MTVGGDDFVGVEAMSHIHLSLAVDSGGRGNAKR